MDTGMLTRKQRTRRSSKALIRRPRDQQHHGTHLRDVRARADADAVEHDVAARADADLDGLDAGRTRAAAVGETEKWGAEWG